MLASTRPDLTMVEIVELHHDRHRVTLSYNDEGYSRRSFYGKLVKEMLASDEGDLTLNIRLISAPDVADRRVF